MAIDAARAKSLFLAASDLDDPAHRAAYVDRGCGGDAELRARVEALLRANDAAPLPDARLKMLAVLGMNFLADNDQRSVLEGTGGNLIGYISAP